MLLCLIVELLDYWTTQHGAAQIFSLKARTVPGLNAYSGFEMMLANGHFVPGLVGISAEQQLTPGFPWTAADLQSDSSGGAASSLRYRGLGWDRKFGCWRVRIFYNGKQRHVGRFRDTLTAARAYNKVVTFLYGDNAILNLLPPGDDDTFDIPYAIRQAKIEAQTTPCSAPACPSSNSVSSLTTSIASGDHLSFSTNSNGSCSNMLQLSAAQQAELQLQDLLLPLGTSSMLALSSGLDLQNLSDSPLDSPLLCAGLPADLAGTASEPFLHPSTGFHAGMGPSTTSMQVPLSANGACFLQDPQVLTCSMANTQSLLDASTQRLQLLELNNALLSGGTNVYNTHTAGLSTGLLQASTGLLALQEPALTTMRYQQPALAKSVAVPASLALTSEIAPAGLALGTPAQHVSTPGVVMGYPVLGQCLGDQGLVQAALPAQQLSAVGTVNVSQPAQLAASNGMVVMFAPAPPA